ncbi:MAG: tol-pal system protein YbgF [Zoogloeaceae bacterium]|jgi:tol-pal system protein YbgF|nr:tol-pal system protein YbgF [Zoogloeaceae bacterium]
MPGRLFASLLCRATLFVALFATLLAISPARAALFDDDEARKRIDDLRTETNARLRDLEAASRGQLALANEIEALKAEVARLRGQIEVLTNELESTQKRQKDFYIDLDERLRKLEPQTGAENSDARPAADPAAETRDYEAALNLFKAGKHKDALAAFLAFINAYPSSAFLPSAHYWAGSAHYQLGEYKKAIDLFTKLAATWPDDAKAPDALLGQANCQQESGDAKGAKKTLETLVAEYPASAAATVAKQRLAPRRR